MGPWATIWLHALASNPRFVEDGVALPVDGTVSRIALAPVEEASSSAVDDRPVGAPATPDTPGPRPALEIFCFGPQRVLIDGAPIASWPKGRGRSIFNYLAAHRGRPAPKEVLMDLFWPGADAVAARNNLNATIYGLRRALGQQGASASYVIYRNESYLLNPAVETWVDTDAFHEAFQSGVASDQVGEESAAIRHYQDALRIYAGEFQAEDRYDEWLFDLRQKYRNEFARLATRLAALKFARGEYNECITVCDRQLAADRCDEAPHRQLMRCYVRLGQHHLALRQFYHCREVLARDFDTPPSVETVALFHRIRARQPL